ncbi:MAG: indole-3-glycerol phosphate synthase TrpC [Bacteroidetes bacterium]|nr:indole-3-glycerol phosphate synthase TrpC [Bacteroidota bacterium]MBL0077828.1 indole-3-glycerol phosphate synthase TrpC [Bacteroidota bacterium]
MNILEKIVVTKKQEIALSKAKIPIQLLEKSDFFDRQTVSLKSNILKPESTGIIAEFKRKSPSKGIINDSANVEDVVRQYEMAGVAGASVLTDNEYFGGSYEDLISARNKVAIPLLRKDFMVDDYQFFEAKSWGADVILLIASILSPKEVLHFTNLAKSLGLEVLLELHDESELDHVNELVDMVGINNRNLKTFEVDIDQSIRMANKLGSQFVKIAESGISNINTLKQFRESGFNGFLIGEQFMKTNNPGLACENFIAELR